MTTNAYPTQGSRLYFPNVTASPAVVAPVAQMTGFTNAGGKRTKIPISNFDSGNFHEYKGGMMDASEITFDLIWDFTSANHKLIQQLSQTPNTERDFFFAAGDGTALPTITGSIGAGNVHLKPPVSASPVKITRSGFLFFGYFSMFQLDAALDKVYVVKSGVQMSGAMTPYGLGDSYP
jgi:hypothetical protein